VATARRVTPVQATSALQILAELMARLVVVPGPEGLRHLADIAAAMLDQVPGAVSVLRDPAEQPLVLTCASAVVELIDEPGDRLLQWDLHYDNILAGQREPWLAIGYKPLAGDPGFDLLPDLHNRWHGCQAKYSVRDELRSVLPNRGHA
jgi:streptomycin 6-kinase